MCTRCIYMPPDMGSGGSHRVNFLTYVTQPVPGLKAQPDIKSWFKRTGPVSCFAPKRQPPPGAGCSTNRCIYSPQIDHSPSASLMLAAHALTRAAVPSG